MSLYNIRPAQLDDVARLPAIEASAGRLFESDSTLEWLAEDEPMSLEQHKDSLRIWQEATGDLNGGTWVAVHVSTDCAIEEVVGFISTSLKGVGKHPKRHLDTHVPGSIEQRKALYVHIDELSVHEQHQRRGLAKALIDAVMNFAFQSSISRVSLITIRDLPWNGPFYTKQGFVEIQPEELEKEVGRWAWNIWQDDQSHFERIRERRCFMIRRL